jgi:hypothetical protein
VLRMEKTFHRSWHRRQLKLSAAYSHNPVNRPVALWHFLSVYIV